MKLVLAAIVVVAATAAARADSPKLAEARQAVEAVRYDRARALLLEALRDGGNSPRAMAELYQLSASTAIVLGDRELAEQYYRRWLALEPAAALPADVAPKLREPFVAAQAYMAAHGRLAVAARRAGTRVEVTVESDPLAMAVAAALDGGAARVAITEGTARLAAPAGAPGAPGAPIERIAILDEHGNRLVEVPVADGGSAVRDVAEPERPAPPGRSRFRRWTTWALGTAAFTVVGIGFGYAADAAQDDLEAAIADSSDYFFDAAEAARRRRDRDSLIANLGFAAGGLCAVTAVIMYVTRPAARAVVAPTAAPGAVGFAVTATW